MPRAVRLALLPLALAGAGCIDQATMDRALAERDAELARLRRESAETRTRLAECREALTDKPERAAALAPPPAAAPPAPAAPPAAPPAAAPVPAPAPAAVAPAVTPIVTPIPLAVAPQGEEASYQSAVAKIQAKQPGPARAEFRAFMQRFPQSKLRPNAIFWLAEADYQEQHWSEARTGFLTVSGEYPDHPKSADALYKAALCSLSLGDKQTAIEQLKSVISRFPHSDAAGYAQKKLVELNKRT